MAITLTFGILKIIQFDFMFGRTQQWNLKRRGKLAEGGGEG
jgi:hypothetical protein